MARYTGGEHRGIVYCDGVLLKDVCECDDTLGFAIVTDRDENGQVFAVGDEIAKRLVVGRIEFVMHNK